MRSDVKSYNSWLREESQGSLNTLVASMASLQKLVQVLQSALQLEITMEPSQVQRIIWAINHLEVEIRLLDISLEAV